MEVLLPRQGESIAKDELNTRSIRDAVFGFITDLRGQPHLGNVQRAFRDLLMKNDVPAQHFSFAILDEIIAKQIECRRSPNKDSAFPYYEYTGDDDNLVRYQEDSFTVTLLLERQLSLPFWLKPPSGRSEHGDWLAQLISDHQPNSGDTESIRILRDNLVRRNEILYAYNSTNTNTVDVLYCPCGDYTGRDEHHGNRQRLVAAFGFDLSTINALDKTFLARLCTHFTSSIVQLIEHRYRDSQVRVLRDMEQSIMSAVHSLGHSIDIHIGSTVPLAEKEINKTQRSAQIVSGKDLGEAYSQMSDALRLAMALGKESNAQLLAFYSRAQSILDRHKGIGRPFRCPADALILDNSVFQNIVNHEVRHQHLLEEPERKRFPKVQLVSSTCHSIYVPGGLQGAQLAKGCMEIIFSNFIRHASRSQLDAMLEHDDLVVRVAVQQHCLTIMLPCFFVEDLKALKSSLRTVAMRLDSNEDARGIGLSELLKSSRALAASEKLRFCEFERWLNISHDDLKSNCSISISLPAPKPLLEPSNSLDPKMEFLWSRSRSDREDHRLRSVTGTTNDLNAMLPILGVVYHPDYEVSGVEGVILIPLLNEQNVASTLRHALQAHGRVLCLAHRDIENMQVLCQRMGISCEYWTRDHPLYQASLNKSDSERLRDTWACYQRGLNLTYHVVHEDFVKFAGRAWSPNVVIAGPSAYKGLLEQEEKQVASDCVWIVHASDVRRIVSIGDSLRQGFPSRCSSSRRFLISRVPGSVDRSDGHLVQTDHVLQIFDRASREYGLGFQFRLFDMLDSVIE